MQQQRIRELEKDKQLVAIDSMFKAQEEERSRMARDLHDGLGGMLSGVKLSLGAMKGNIILSEDNTRLFAKVLDQLDHSIRRNAKGGTQHDAGSPDKIWTSASDSRLLRWFK